MMPPAILLENRRFLVIDKPAGLAVHPGPRTPESLEQWLPALAPPRRPPPRPVHRLDRDTSGCLLLARDAAALRRLSAAFSAGEVRKAYRAILLQPPAADQGEMDAALSKISSREAGWRMVPDKAGKAARTHWQILRRAEIEGASAALVEFTPLTGRTHQLRVHATLLAEGCAIMGDPVYGQKHGRGMMLHASRLDVPDPWSTGDNARKTAEAPCPGRFHALGLGWSD